MKNVVKAELWRDHISACVRSGLTASEYCRRNSLRAKSYYYWKRRTAVSVAAGTVAGPGDVAGTLSSQWLRVEAANCLTPKRSQSLTIKISGAEIEVDLGFNPILLRAVVLALGPQPC